MLPSRQQAPQTNQPNLTPEMQALLEQLKDIHEPAAVGWWPPAPGWWLLAGLVLLAIAGAFTLFWRARRKRLQNRYRAEGIALLNAIDTSSAAAVEEINTILKRVAVVTFGRRACASLTGQRWIDFLEGTARLDMDAPARRALLEGLYRHGDSDPSGVLALRDFAINWVQQHQLQGSETPTSTPAEAVRV
ncbi:DUF4381 domain-containing protein [Microbulbifer sp. SA54]|uniref:DUF4381 domain-containing protein n=1 Tax=Microbulbifer sp. SA54 TaxID=3401577 RepID=UPI003AAEC290